MVQVHTIYRVKFAKLQMNKFDLNDPHTAVDGIFAFCAKTKL